MTMFEEEQVNIKVNKTRNCQGFPERRKGRREKMKENDKQKWVEWNEEI